MYQAAPVSIGRGLVASSFQYYLTGAENLRVTAFYRFAPLTVDLAWRFWREQDRVIQLGADSMRVTALGVTTTKDFALDAGALVGLRIGTSQAGLQLGELWVRVQLIRGLGGATQVIGTLLQGYVTAENDLAWPGSPLQSQHDGRGAVRHLTFAGVAGPAVQLTVPAGVRWRVVTGRVVLNTSAAVGNRTPFAMALDSFGNAYWVGINSVVTPPSSAGGYAFAAAQSPSAVTALGGSHLPWPDDLELGAGDSVRVQAAGIDAADTWTPATLLVREWLDQ